MTPGLSLLMATIEQVGFVVLAIALFFASWSDFREGLQRVSSPRRFVVLAIVLGLAWATFGFYDLGWDLALLALVLTLSSVFSLLSVRFAVCFWVAALMMRPWEILPESAYLSVLPRGQALLVLASGLFRLHTYKDWKFSWTTEDVAFLGFSLFSYLTTFVGPNPLEAQDIWTNIFSKSLMMFVLVRFFVRKREDVRALCLTIGLSGLTLVVITLTRLFLDPRLTTAKARAELFGLLGDPNDLAAVLLLSMPLLVGELRRIIPTRLVSFLVMGALSVLSVWAVIQTQSRGAFVGVLSAVGAILFLQIRSRRVLAVVLPSALLVGGLLLFTTLRRSESDLSASQSSRLAYWQAGWRMAIRHPATGVGFNAYPLRFQEYADASKVESALRTAHSTWVLVLAETGFLGLAMFLWLVLGASWRVFINRFEEPALFVAFVGYFAAASFLSHAYLLLPYALVALGLCSRPAQSAKAPAQN